MRGEGRGKRAAGAVGMTPGDAFVPELSELRAVVEQVDDVVGRKVAALDDHVRRAKGEQPPRRLAAVVLRRDAQARECLRFRDIRRDDECARQ